MGLRLTRSMGPGRDSTGIESWDRDSPGVWIQEDAPHGGQVQGDVGREVPTVWRQSEVEVVGGVVSESTVVSVQEGSECTQSVHAPS